MSNIARMPQILKESDNFQLFDDFLWLISPHSWTSTISDLGGVAAAGVGGIATLTNSDGTVADNDETYLATTAASFRPGAGRPMYAEALIQFTEANVDDANVAFGFASGVAANLIVDDGAGMRVTGTVIAIYKVDGETFWRCVSRNGASVTITQSNTIAGGAAYQRLSIELVDVLALSATVVFKVDGIVLRDAATSAPIRHTLDLTSIAAAAVFVGGKNGFTNLETTLVDYIQANQVR